MARKQSKSKMKPVTPRRTGGRPTKAEAAQFRKDIAKLK